MELKFFKVTYGKNEVNIPYYEIVGKKSGPMGFISAGMHGNEINGINIVKNFVRVAKITELEKKLKGVLIVFPILNITGFEVGKRRVPEDGKDLNRQFGRSTVNSLSSAIAFELSHNFFKKCDFGIDFHDSGSTLVYLPHLRIHKTNDNKNSVELNLAKKFGTKIIFERKGARNMMANALPHNFGTSVLTVEVGGGGFISPEYVKPLMSSIKNILATNKMIDQKVKIPTKQFVLTEKTGIKAKQSGILNLKIELGQKVVKNEKLGTIFYPQLQKEEILFAEKTGFVIAKRVINQVKKGAIIYSLLA